MTPFSLQKIPWHRFNFIAFPKIIFFCLTFFFITTKMIIHTGTWKSLRIERHGDRRLNVIQRHAFRLYLRRLLLWFLLKIEFATEIHKFSCSTSQYEEGRRKIENCWKMFSSISFAFFPFHLLLVFLPLHLSFSCFFNAQ